MGQDLRVRLGVAAALRQRLLARHGVLAHRARRLRFRLCSLAAFPCSLRFPRGWVILGGPFLRPPSLRGIARMRPGSGISFLSHVRRQTLAALPWLTGLEWWSFGLSFKAVVTGLNVLAGHGLRLGDRVCNQAQRKALSTVQGKIDRMCSRLARTEPPSGAPDSILHDLVGPPRGPSAKAVPLDTLLCDVLDQSGLVYPTPYLPEALRSAVADADFMFPDVPDGLDKLPGPKGAQRVEYLKFMHRELFSGKT